jgi:hypothetical protein
VRQPEHDPEPRAQHRARAFAFGNQRATGGADRAESFRDADPGGTARSARGWRHQLASHVRATGGSGCREPAPASGAHTDCGATGNFASAAGRSACASGRDAPGSAAPADRNGAAAGAGPAAWRSPALAGEPGVSSKTRTGGT